MHGCCSLTLRRTCSGDEEVRLVPLRSCRGVSVTSPETVYQESSTVHTSFCVFEGLSHLHFRSMSSLNGLSLLDPVLPFSVPPPSHNCFPLVFPLPPVGQSPTAHQGFWVMFGPGHQVVFFRVNNLSSSSLRILGRRVSFLMALSRLSSILFPKSLRLTPGRLLTDPFSSLASTLSGLFLS